MSLGPVHKIDYIYSIMKIGKTTFWKRISEPLNVELFIFVLQIREVFYWHSAAIIVWSRKYNVNSLLSNTVQKSIFTDYIWGIHDCIKSSCEGIFCCLSKSWALLGKARTSTSRYLLYHLPIIMSIKSKYSKLLMPFSSYVFVKCGQLYLSIFCYKSGRAPPDTSSIN